MQKKESEQIDFIALCFNNWNNITFECDSSERCFFIAWVLQKICYFERNTKHFNTSCSKYLLFQNSVCKIPGILIKSTNNSVEILHILQIWDNRVSYVLRHFLLTLSTVVLFEKSFRSELVTTLGSIFTWNIDFWNCIFTSVTTQEPGRRRFLCHFQQHFHSELIFRKQQVI